MAERLYPDRPILAASIAVFRHGRVLLARRSRPPAEALYSLPGGVVEVGETLAAAALRELAEETGVIARVVGFNTHVEVIEPDDKLRVRRHFVIASFVGAWVGGEAATGPEVSDVIWADPLAMGAWPVTPQLGNVLARALSLVRGQGVMP
jgi:ADP-ribose pyrophosphatase YjhB (NUDIX family)